MAGFAPRVNYYPGIIDTAQHTPYMRPERFSIMSSIDRKAATAAYKKRDVPAGIYALTCAETGQRWVGHSPDLDAMPNRLWFTLRLGNHRAIGLQAAYSRYGQDAIAIDVLERFEDDVRPEGAALKERLTFWRDRIDALPA